MKPGWVVGKKCAPLQAEHAEERCDLPKVLGRCRESRNERHPRQKPRRIIPGKPAQVFDDHPIWHSRVCEVFRGINKLDVHHYQVNVGQDRVAEPVPRKEAVCLDGRVDCLLFEPSQDIARVLHVQGGFTT